MNKYLAPVVYAAAVLGVSLLAFGPWGIPAAVMVLLFWWLTQQSEPLWRVLAFSVFLAIVVGLFLGPQIPLAQEAAMNNQCLGHLKKQWLALYSYNDSHGRLPPVRFDPSGTGHYHCWRAAILYLDYEEVYRNYRFDLPWDAPVNRDHGDWHLQKMLECPVDKEQGNSVYLAVTGPETVWGDGEERSLADVTDDPASTILCLEAPRLTQAWNEPRDLTFDEAVELLTSPSTDHEQNAHYTRRSIIHKPGYQRNVAMCDGSVRVLSVPLDRETAVALLTASGDEEVDVDSLRHPGPTELDWLRIWSFAAFVVVALLPLGKNPRLR